MIKGITITHVLPNPGQAEELADLLAALGFERTSHSHTLLVPVARLELRTQLGEYLNPLRIEVTGLDDIRLVAESLLCEKTIRTIAPIVEDDPEIRFLSIELFSGRSITFWEWCNPTLGKPVAVEGDLSAVGMQFAIVVARWNSVITDRLLQGTLDALYRSGAKASDVEVVRVPGAWEIPSASRKMAESGRFDAVVTLGLLLRGETAHYEAIYREVSRGIGQSQQETGIPHAFGVLTCETLEQALDRAGLKSGNKGFEAACSAIEMVSLHRKLANSYVLCNSRG